MAQKYTPLISNDLLDILVCPLTGAGLEYIVEENILINNKNPQFKYKILDGIPDCTLPKKEMVLVS